MSNVLLFVLLVVGLPAILVLFDLHLRKKQKKAVLEAAERVEVKPKGIKEVTGNVSVDLPSANSTEVNDIMTERELDFAEQQMDSYAQIINDRYLSGKITKEQYKKYLTKIDQWFSTLDYLWDGVQGY